MRNPTTTHHQPGRYKLRNGGLADFVCCCQGTLEFGKSQAQLSLLEKLQFPMLQPLRHDLRELRSGWLETAKASHKKLELQPQRLQAGRIGRLRQVVPDAQTLLAEVGQLLHVFLQE